MGELIEPAALNSAALSAKFKRDGIVKLEALFDSTVLAECRRCYDWSLANPSPHAVCAFEGTRHQHHVDFSNLAALEMYGSLVRHPVFADTLASLLGSQHVWYFSEEIFARRGGMGGRTPWHQDTAYQPWGGRQWANVWISFDTLPKKNALEVVRGSHLGPQYDGSNYKDAEDPAAPLHGGQWTPLPDIERERADRPDSWDVISYPTKPGDAIIINPRGLHGGAPVDEGTPDRSTLVLRFFGDDAVFQPLPYGTNYGAELKGPAVYEAHYGGLNAGDPMRSRAFVQIR